MDLRTVMTISTLLFVAADQTTPQEAVNASSSPAQISSTICSCPHATPAATAATISTPSSPTPVMGLLTVKWKSNCKGAVNLVLYQPTISTPVCHDGEKNVSIFLENVCEDKKGCKGTPMFMKGQDKQNGYHIKESGAAVRNSCETLTVQCTVEVCEDNQGKHAYKVVIALLCCVLLALFLIRFTRPTINALQKRLSDRRQNRWVGPTQSHSVSYHRGKTAIKSNDGEKRLSYPALERLTVTDSREPSSNRNSDFNF